MSVPAHVFQATAKYGVEATFGERVAAGLDFPCTITNLEFDPAEREYNEAFGPGSDILQSQELLTLRFPITLDFQVNGDVGGTFLANYCLRSLGALQSLSWEFAHSDTGTALWGARCNSMRLSSSQRGVLTASTEWIGKNSLGISAPSWTPPTYAPYVWAMGSWTIDGNPSGYITSIDITLENNIQELYAMSSAAGDYRPTHLEPGYMGVRADVRAATEYDISVYDDIIDAYLTFVSGTRTLQIELTGGTYRGKRGTIPQDDLIQWGIPVVFRDMVITEA